MLEMCSQNVCTDGFMLLKMQRPLDFPGTPSAPAKFSKRRRLEVMRGGRLPFPW